MPRARPAAWYCSRCGQRARRVGPSLDPLRPMVECITVEHRPRTTVGLLDRDDLDAVRGRWDRELHARAQKRVKVHA